MATKPTREHALVPTAKKAGDSRLDQTYSRAMAGSNEWDETVFRRSLADLSARPPADADALWLFQQYWARSLDDAEASGAVTGVERDVLFADLRAAVHSLPGVTVVEHSAGAWMRLPFTSSSD
jgi:hypothetical protein